MKLKWSLVAAVAGAQFGTVAFAQDTNSSSADIVALKQEVQALEQKVNALEQQQSTQGSPTQDQQSAQVRELDQKVRVLQRQRELDQQAAADAAKTQPKITLDQNGFSFSSANSNFIASLHGVLQVDSRSYLNDGGANLNSFLVRRARPIFAGTVFHDFDFNFTPDFGGGSASSTVVIYDAYLNYHYNPAFQVEAGRFKSPVGLEALQQDVWTTFNERSLVTDLVPNRDTGFELHGDLFSGRASYAAGIFNGAPDYITPTASTLDADNDKAFAGRLFLQPFKTSDEAFLQGLGFGVGGSYEDDRRSAADLTTGYKTDGQQTFYAYGATVLPNGTHWRISPQGYYYYGPFSLLGEYAISDQQVKTPAAHADLKNSAWEATVGWVLTGENATYNGITPRHPFDPRNGHWGAWQVVARYADLYIDDSHFATFAAPGSASGAKAWSAGINWFLNRDIRLDASFSRTTFNSGGDGTTAVTARPENVLFTRVQLGF